MKYEDAVIRRDILLAFANSPDTELKAEEIREKLMRSTLPSIQEVTEICSEMTDNELLTVDPDEETEKIFAVTQAGWAALDIIEGVGLG